jgi:phosphopantetheinyl transferase (holo-ACP synthase)
VPVGVDVVAIARIADDVERWGDTLLARVLTPAESAWCAARIEHGRDLATGVAACVAAKEAVIKVLGGRPRGFSWRCVELIPDMDAGVGSECRALVSGLGAPGGDHAEHAPAEIVGRWRCLLDPAVAPDWDGVLIEAAAIVRQAHVVAVAAVG